MYTALQDDLHVRTQAEAAIALAQNNHFAQWLAMGRVLHGWALVRQGRANRGMEQLRLGVQTWRTLDAKLSLPLVLGLLAEALGIIDQPEEGLTVVQEALDLIELGGPTNRLAHLLRVRGQLRLAVAPRDTTGAEADFQQSIAIARQQQATWLALQAALCQCHLLCEQGQTHAAQDALIAVYHEIDEGFETKSMREAKALLEQLSSDLKQTNSDQ